jgi:hypothetical protein
MGHPIVFWLVRGEQATAKKRNAVILRCAQNDEQEQQQIPAG